MKKEETEYKKDGEKYKLVIKRDENSFIWSKEIPLETGSIGLHYIESGGKIFLHKDILDSQRRKIRQKSLPSGLYTTTMGSNLLITTSKHGIFVIPLSTKIKEVKVIQRKGQVNIYTDSTLKATFTTNIPKSENNS